MGNIIMGILIWGYCMGKQCQNYIPDFKTKWGCGMMALVLLDLMDEGGPRAQHMENLAILGILEACKTVSRWVIIYDLCMGKQCQNFRANFSEQENLLSRKDSHLLWVFAES